MNFGPLDTVLGALFAVSYTRLFSSLGPIETLKTL